ncbi:hypothetical protein GGS23DRAFT_364536 [Durotheca rogersii]|uniref:uncharacterized protein n=1 Tax=Durotheca rogersii TaxID=419775 RepID=UPI002220EA10|nr:uncharacterized protein GGS23DRAFT_364536 [Durotheca rogersii]KAI5866018.1 hypothetical protein GGS23DRAFT_364536 [Durotheca rogersii]
MVASTFVPSLIALSSAASAVASVIKPPRFVHVERQEAGWPGLIATSVINETSSKFASKVARWSSYEAPTFDFVFIPETEAELSAGLQYLTSQNIPFLTKSGGHGYSTTLRQIQDGVLINMEKFNYSRVDDDFTATIGTGATFNDMVYTIGTAGRETTVGSCPCVGVTGATLGGGVGRLQGLHGLASDAVRKVRLALWNGTIIEASDNVNADLFWGIRGAGQNFGVVIETTFETFPATNGGLHYEAQMTFNISSLGDVIDTLNSLLPLDPGLAIVTIVAADPATLEPALLVNLVFAGPEAKGKQLAKPFIDLSTSTVESLLTWVDLPTKGAGGFNNVQCIKGRRNSLYGLTQKVIDRDSVLEMAEDFDALVQANPALSSSAFLVESFGVQAIDALPDNFSAFPHRGRLDHFFEILVSYEDDAVAQVGNDWAVSWRDHFRKPEISGYDTVVVYQNYGHGDEAPSVLYGSAKWRQKRLTSLKNRFDPHNVFGAYHPIPTALADWS